MSTVYLSSVSKTTYPSESFNPDCDYPEYPFVGEINANQNVVYSAVRDCLRGLGYDKEHYGTPEWNPLGDLVKPGQNIVIKPNLVMDHNANSQVTNNSMECLVTHPSCIRAICDYAIIALHGKGTIVIADAPMQGCDFRLLTNKMHYNEIITFYKNKGIKIALLDLRQYQATMNKNKVIVKKEYTTSKGIIVRMGSKSAFLTSKSNGLYQVSDYSKEITQSFHHDEIHDYEISDVILNADLIINFCKPKTHRLAGITASMKNMVGAAYNKASLPHRSAGSVSEGGDAYLNKSWLKRKADATLTLKIDAETNGKIFKATILRFIYGSFLVTGKIFGKDKYFIGSWYGNDTIWRTVVDLNYIIRYANKRGELHGTTQRKQLCLGDMIISGQHNGPVSPEPKAIGIILAAEDTVAFDSVVCAIMGFSNDKIPLFRAIQNRETFLNYKEPYVKSNYSKYNDQLSKIKFPTSWKFLPADGWSEIIK